MADKKFILQGLTAETHRDAICQAFDIDSIKRVLLSVAFVSEGGVQLLRDKIAPLTPITTVFAGIRNDITSHQGLTALLPLTKHLYVVDTGSRQIIFHPKMYLVRGSKRARLIIGSANLTLGGLNNNIEAGMLIDFDLDQPADKATVETIEFELDKLPSNFGSNIQKVGAAAEVDAMLASGRVIDETAILPPRPNSSGGRTGNSDTIPRINLNVIPLRRSLKKAKPTTNPTLAVAVKPKAASPATTARAPTPMAVGIAYEPVWQSKPLTLRDLNIPDGGNTNKTGSMSLDKGLLPAAVDHRHYFRESIFNGLDWKVTTRKTTEEAQAKFHLVIKGISYGEFELRIGHTMGKTSKAYQQNNAMTRLSWGLAVKLIANPDLKDRTLTLYRDLADPTRFLLEID